jgi:polyribonucleotide nucleotidyltransferase
MKKFTRDFMIGDSKITLSGGVLAPQANASVVARLGNTVILATVVLGRIDEKKDYFPLSVEFADRLYAGGIIKGGKWVKRELNPADNSILTGRIIDRSLRPLFPKGLKNEVQIITTVLSNDKENDTVVPAFLAASVALSLSDIPFNGPVSAIRVGLVDDKLVLCPTSSQQKESKMDILTCTSPAGVNMIEADAKIVDNEKVLAGIELAKKTADEINHQIEDLVKEFGLKKQKFTPVLPDEKIIKEIETKFLKDIQKFLSEGKDGAHIAGEEEIFNKVLEYFKDKIEKGELSSSKILEATSQVIKKYFRKQTLAGQRYDKRKMDEIRPLQVQVGVLPCTHGSTLFQRGLTQALTITTLSSLSDMQSLQDSSGETTKRYIHYYTAMPFSTAQTGRVGRPGRREVGHGALAEKALIPVLPSEEEFPYTILLNSEVLSQNGSSSMASTCGSTMSMLDAGVPLKDKVAGISIGMISESDDKYALLTDIAGVEDHFGDMDFKITGTKDGVTAIQLDIKRQGLTMPMIQATFVASTKARLAILAKMESVLSKHRDQVSEYAPKIKLMNVPEKKIGDIIGGGGKNIKALMEKYEVQIDINDKGQVSVAGQDIEKINDCLFQIESSIREINVGEEFEGVVTRVENYGAFVEFLPGREALLHVSELATGFVDNPSSLVKVDDKIKVTVSGFNDNHQIKLAAPEFKKTHQSSAQRPDAPTQEFKKFRPDFGSQRPRR